MSSEQVSFESLYERHYSEILRFCFWKMRNQQDAEDLALEAFVKAYINWEKFDPARGSFRAWIFEIARNLCTDFTRSSEYRNRQRSESLSEMSTNQDYNQKLPQESVENNFDKQEVLRAIEDCIERLGKRADFIRLYYYHDFTLAEIAQNFHKGSPNWARKRLKKVEALLKACFESRGLDAFSLV
jgi:RNA polymerase sigma-70 factor (ECF subfamily)